MVGRRLTILGLLLCCGSMLLAQTQRADSAAIRQNTVPLFDSAAPAPRPVKKAHDPRKATRRSAILPGWGQAYNREYWKIPLVYTAIGIPVGFFIDNNTWYKRTKLAYEIRVTKDTARFPHIHPRLTNLYATRLQYYRNEFRRNRDYSVLWFLIAWGLNVVDATVFGHLKDFDVSDDLSLQVNPVISSRQQGVSLVFNFKNSEKKPLPAAR